VNLSADDRLKRDPDSENEVHELAGHEDAGRCRATPVAQFDPVVALAITDGLRGVVQRAHASPAATTLSAEGVVRAQGFEEGHVYMLESPFDGYSADRYLMDFYDVEERDLCSRMHLHTGMRFVRMMTGPGTQIRTSSLSPLEVTHVEGATSFTLTSFTDVLPAEGDEPERLRYNLVVPENSWVDLQIPRGVSHQFKAIGPNAVIDSVHPEESLETVREHMSGYKMMAQTIFLNEHQPAAVTCVLPTE